LLCSYSLASDHLQKTVFYYVDVIRLIYPAWSPDTGVFPFSSLDADRGFSISATSYASNVDAGVRAMLDDDVDDDVSEDPGDDVTDDITKNPGDDVIDNISGDPGNDVIADISRNPVDDVTDDVSEDPGGHRQALDIEEWIGNTSSFLRVIGDATAKVHRLVTSEPLMTS